MAADLRPRQITDAYDFVVVVVVWLVLLLLLFCCCFCLFVVVVCGEGCLFVCCF